MQLPRRHFLQLAAGAAALPAASWIAQAQAYPSHAYPSRPVRIIVPVAPGGALDILARLMGQWLSERLRAPFVIENRPGAGTNIGVEAVVRAPADGYTLLLIPRRECFPCRGRAVQDDDRRRYDPRALPRGRAGID